MRTILLSLASIFIYLILPGCEQGGVEQGNGNIITKDTVFNYFNELELEGNFEVELIKSSTSGLSIEADENLFQYITIDQDGDVVEVKSDRTLKGTQGIKLYVKYTELELIDVAGAAAITSSDRVAGDFLRLNMSGAGTINLEVEVKALQVNISGAGAINLSGKVIEQQIQLSGAGGLEAYDLISKNCKIEISGVGGAAVNVEGELEAYVSGVGGVRYKGNPSEVKTDVSGLGTVSKYDSNEDADTEQ